MILIALVPPICSASDMRLVGFYTEINLTVNQLVFIGNFLVEHSSDRWD